MTPKLLLVLTLAILVIPAQSATFNTDFTHSLYQSLDNTSIEHFGVILLDANDSIIGVYELSTGTGTEVNFNIAALLWCAKSHMASGIITYHNHPSGTIYTPSGSDLKRWGEIQTAVNHVGIRYVDSVILSKAGYYDEVSGKIVWYKKME